MRLVILLLSLFWALPALAEIKPQLIQAYIARKTMDAVNARAAALSERLRKGEAIEAVAASAGVQVERITGLDRLRASQDPQVAKAVGGDLLNKMFGLKSGEVFIADAGPPRVASADDAEKRVNHGDTEARR